MFQGPVTSVPKPVRKLKINSFRAETQLIELTGCLLSERIEVSRKASRKRILYNIAGGGGGEGGEEPGVEG